MGAKARRPLADRVVSAAEAALADHHYVSPIDVLVGIGFLARTYVREWRTGRIPCLEDVLPGNRQKISQSLVILGRWARGRGLPASETTYLVRSRGERRALRFSKSGDPDTEKAYRTHFLSTALSERKKQELYERLSSPPELVVFWTLRDSQCSECNAKLPSGSFLLTEACRALCMVCTDMDHLEYLPSGDPALTRRARRHSTLSAVVVRFSRTRKRYERQGILVEQAALDKAREECAADADLRAVRRGREIQRRAKADRVLVEQLAHKIRAIFPRCPPDETRAIAEHTAMRGSGRVGRSAAGRALDLEAVSLAVVAAVRHRHTPYDELLMRGMDRTSARLLVQERIDAILVQWQSPRDHELTGSAGRDLREE